MRRRRAEKRLTEEEGADGDGLGEHEHDDSEDEHLGEQHEGSAGRRSERGADRAVAYSLLMTSTPRTPRTSWQKKLPARLIRVGSSVALLTGDIVDQ